MNSQQALRKQVSRNNPTKTEFFGTYHSGRSKVNGDRVLFGAIETEKGSSIVVHFHQDEVGPLYTLDTTKQNVGLPYLIPNMPQ